MTVDCRCLLVIPARAGSKGVPGKNLRTVGGRSLVERAVRSALAAQLPTEVIVSTDSAEIAAVAGSAGALVIERPAALAGDTTSSEAVLLHVIEQLHRDGGVCALVQCTSPFTAPADIDGTIQLVLSGADSAFAGAESHAFLWEQRSSGVVPVNHDAASRPRRQDLARTYVETGSVYAMTVSGLVAHGSRFFGRTEVHPVPTSRSLEIDTEEDLRVANQLAPNVGSEWLAALLSERSPLGVVLDFDGVMTDDRAILGEDGHESVRVSRSDGYGISQLTQAGLFVGVLSREVNPVVERRCQKLGIECRQGIEEKLPELERWLHDLGLPLARVVYVGNDVTDVACMRAVGIGAAVADAHPEALAAADVVLERAGGDGAVRELADAVLRDAAHGVCDDRGQGA